MSAQRLAQYQQELAEPADRDTLVVAQAKRVKQEYDNARTRLVDQHFTMSMPRAATSRCTREHVYHEYRLICVMTQKSTLIRCCRRVKALRSIRRALPPRLKNDGSQ
ncbi:hypothetical protein HJFPF1_00862 [Paramyrothecium foliicola]|nr:hypothetical protein HJFPF1_00862 [Paramyrothecium foliicola]